MTTPFEINSFEEYLQTVRNELPEGRKYFRGQTKLVSAGYALKPSLGRFAHLSDKSPRELDDLEREVLDVFSNHLVTHVQHLPRDEWQSLAIAQHHGRPHTPQDQTWIDSFFGHLKGDWPHLETIIDPVLLEDERATARTDK